MQRSARASAPTSNVKIALRVQDGQAKHLLCGLRDLQASARAEAAVLARRIARVGMRIAAKGQEWADLVRRALRKTPETFNRIPINGIAFHG